MELEDWLKWKGIEETSTPVSLAKDRMIISAENEQGQRKALKVIICMLEEMEFLVKEFFLVKEK